MPNAWDKAWQIALSPGMSGRWAIIESALRQLFATFSAYGAARVGHRGTAGGWCRPRFAYGGRQRHPNISAPPVSGGALM